MITIVCSLATIRDMGSVGLASSVTPTLHQNSHFERRTIYCLEGWGLGLYFNLSSLLCTDVETSVALLTQDV